MDERFIYVIIASNGGLDYHPGWFFNLKANPATSIQVLDKVIQVDAQIVPDEDHSRLWEKLIQIAPLYDGYTKRTKRIIPLVALTPRD